MELMINFRNINDSSKQNQVKFFSINIFSTVSETLDILNRRTENY